MRWILLIICFLCAGCYAPVKNLNAHFSQKHRLENHISSASVTSQYFTAEAFSLVKDIPCVIGRSITGAPWAVGVNFWTKLGGVLTGNGYSRKVVLTNLHKISRPTGIDFGPQTIIHEYLHHIDSIGREDDTKKLIDICEFKSAFERMALDKKWKELHAKLLNKGDKWYTNIFGIGEYSELIAYAGARMAWLESGPEYMWHVFRRVLRQKK